MVLLKSWFVVIVCLQYLYQMYDAKEWVSHIDCGLLCIYEKLKDGEIYNIQYMKQILG